MVLSLAAPDGRCIRRWSEAVWPRSNVLAAHRVVVRVSWLLLALAAITEQRAHADDAPIYLRVGLRSGVESSSTVKRSQATDWSPSSLTLGLLADAFSARWLAGAGASVTGAPFSYGALRAELHAGAHAQTTSGHPIATVGVGVQEITHICSSCRSVALPFTELRGELNYAGEHVELGIWGAIIVDLGREHVSGVYDYDVGGVTFGGGVIIAWAGRRSRPDGARLMVSPDGGSRIGRGTP